MTILQEVQTWSDSLPNWQNEAILRLFLKHTLDQNDIDDLYAMLKSEHDIIDPENRQPRKFTADLISVPTATDEIVKLISIRDLLNVNAIAPKQRLSFNSDGLTIVYGDNGAGKSGYCRVLKHACRARDQTEKIFPNLNLPVEERGSPEAIFEININGENKEDRWIYGTPATDVLSTIAIFDDKCARAYVDEEDDFSYVPYGLDIFEGLANVCRELKSKIEKEQRQYIPNLAQFDDLCESKAVGDVIKNLSINTNREVVESLASVNNEDIRQHEILERSLRTENPKEKAQLLRMQGQRLIVVAKNFSDKLVNIESSKIKELKDLDNDWLAAQNAAKLAAQKFNSSQNYLPGTGGATWRMLFETARKFSAEAYPGKVFPYIGADAKCPLCQQFLVDGASRLKDFEEYVQQETEITAKNLRSELDAAIANFERNKTIIIDDVTLTEIALHDPRLSQECKDFDKALTGRFEKIRVALSLHDWNDIPDLPLNPIEKIESLSISLINESSSLENVADESLCAEMKAQFIELDARIKLSKRLSAVLTTIDQMKHKVKLTECLSAVKTNAISLKKDAIAEKVITGKLADGLNDEFNKLGAGDLKVAIKHRAARGKSLYKLTINLNDANNPGDILSEGEQRIIAIGSFLAEVGLNGGSGGIIFDDPVSSLDHRHRERVAKRLAQEAQKRQVIVFTHDIYFLCILIDEAEKAEIPIETQNLVKKPQGFGVPEKGIPFEGMSTKERIKFLKAQQQEIEKIYRLGDEPEFRSRTINAYYYLRDTWERAVEEVLLRKVVLRFRRGIETNRLREVSVENVDYLIVDQGMSKCSIYCHDKAVIGGIAVPNPDELLDDISSLENWRTVIEERSKIVAKSRQ